MGLLSELSVHFGTVAVSPSNSKRLTAHVWNPANEAK